MSNGLEKKTISSVPLSNFILSGLITLTDTSRLARANQILLSCQFCEVYGSIKVRNTYPGGNSTMFYTEMLCP